jgi:phospholipid-binding lipoprotein MlaA
VKSLAIAACAALAAFFGGCAEVPKDPIARQQFEEANDPMEPMNRRIFAFNVGADRHVIKPVALGYIHMVPSPARDCIRNFTSNLGEPLVIANDLLQLRLKRASVSFARLLTNTTLGIGGVFDIAGKNGFAKQTGDFGQTLYTWGLKDGPYLVLPLLGPSNPRDAVGLGVDTFLDPVRYLAKGDDYPIEVRYAPAVVAGIDQRSRSIDALDAIQKDSVDYYASLRSLFRQHREAQLHGDDVPLMPTQESFYDDPGADPVPAPRPVSR